VCSCCRYGTDKTDSYSHHCNSASHRKLMGETEWLCKCGEYCQSMRALKYHIHTCDYEPPATNTVISAIPSVVQIPGDTGHQYADLLRQNAALVRQVEMYSKTIETMRGWVGDVVLACGICETKSNSLTLYTDQYTTSRICKDCCIRMTGFTSMRIELIMREYLTTNYDKPILFADKRLRGEACLAYRPDITYADHTRVVHVECDENQHASYGCDEKRITEIYGEYPGKTAIWIRWNPDVYGNGIQAPQGERLSQLVKLLYEIETMTFDTKIHVFYMYYDEDHPSIVKNIAKTFVNPNPTNDIQQDTIL